jgi:hypothetical protein
MVQRRIWSSTCRSCFRGTGYAWRDKKRLSDNAKRKESIYNKLYRGGKQRARQCTTRHNAEGIDAYVILWEEHHCT